MCAKTIVKNNLTVGFSFQLVIKQLESALPRGFLFSIVRGIDHKC